MPRLSMPWRVAASLFAGLVAIPLLAEPPENVEAVRAPYVPTPHNVVERMLEMAGVGPDDVVYDLGSGDGRIVIAAARRGARAVGFEIDPELVETSRKKAEAAGVAERTRFETEDLFGVDLSEATVVTVYLLPELNLRLRPKLFEELAPGTRVVSHAFDMWEWRADETVVVEYEERGHTLYAWVMPARVAGIWRWRSEWGGQRERTLVLNLSQTFQRVRGSLDVGRGPPKPISNGRLQGNRLTFEVGGPDGEDLVFEGSVEDGRLKGRLGDMAVDGWLTPPGGAR